MNSYLTLIGSFIIGGLFLLSINRYHASFNQNSDEKILEGINIQNSASIIKLIEHDFNRIGYGDTTSLYESNVKAIKKAVIDSIYFSSDINSDGTVDMLKYYLSPIDSILYRVEVINNMAEEYQIPGVTLFQIKYLDATGNEIFNLTNLATLNKKIRTFEIELMVEGKLAYDDKNPPKFYWQTKITPPNISRY